MSENYRFYEAKMAEKKARWHAERPLHQQLIELLKFVLECEANWLD
jgi:hypothetical protein